LVIYIEVRNFEKTCAANLQVKAGPFSFNPIGSSIFLPKKKKKQFFDLFN
jgi:hypothetical protein